MTHSIWVEKYRPDSLDGYVGNETLKTKITRYIATADIPHLLFVGPSGTGKTTMAKILVSSIPSDVLFLNASDDNNIETVRGKIKSFASTMGMEALKIIVLDEFDGFSRAGQEALRNMMEKYSASTRFILTANYIERVIDPIVSRVQTFRIQPMSVRDVCVHVATLLKTEGVTYIPTDVKFLVNSFYPDIRKVINETQLNVVDGVLALDTQAVLDNDVKMKIVSLLKGSKHMDTVAVFSHIRQAVANAQIRDFTEIYRILYDNVDEISSDPTKVPDLILIIAEGQCDDAVSIDKEINCMATLIRILQLLS